MSALKDEVIGVRVFASLDLQRDAGGQKPIERNGVFERVGFKVGEPLLIILLVVIGETGARQWQAS